MVISVCFSGCTIPFIFLLESTQRLYIQMILHDVNEKTNSKTMPSLLEHPMNFRKRMTLTACTLNCDRKLGWSKSAPI